MCACAKLISKTSVKKSCKFIRLSLTYTVKIHGRRILDPRGRVTFVRSVAVVCAESTLVSLKAELDAFRAMAKAVASRVQDRESQLVKSVLKIPVYRVSVSPSQVV